MRDYYEDFAENWGQEDIRELKQDDVMEQNSEQQSDWTDRYRWALDRVIDHKLERMAALNRVAEAVDDQQSQLREVDKPPSEIVENLMNENRNAKPLDRHELLDHDPSSELPENNFDKEREEWERLNRMNQRQPDPWNTFGNK